VSVVGARVLFARILRRAMLVIGFCIGWVFQGGRGVVLFFRLGAAEAVPQITA